MFLLFKILYNSKIFSIYYSCLSTKSTKIFGKRVDICKGTIPEIGKYTNKSTINEIKPYKDNCTANLAVGISTLLFTIINTVIVFYLCCGEKIRKRITPGSKN